MAAVFLDLPQELLERIVQEADLPPRSLRLLSGSCTQLHGICLGLYIRKRGLQVCEGTYAIRFTNDNLGLQDLSALKLAKHVRTIWRLECTFGRHVNVRSMTLLLNHVSHFIVVALYNFRELSLCFEIDGEGRWDAGEGVDVIWRFCWTLGRVLEDATRKRDCTVLEVKGNIRFQQLFFPEILPKNSSASARLMSSLASVFQWMYPSKSPSSTSEEGFRDILHGPTWKYEKTVALTHKPLSEVFPTPGSRWQPRLTHFTIGIDALLQPPLLQWTCMVLRASPIKRLTIRDVKLEDKEWQIMTALLPEVVPKLKELHLANLSDLKYNTIATLVDGFPGLQVFSGEEMLVPERPLPPDPILLSINWHLNPTSKEDLTHAYPRWTNLTDLRLPRDWVLCDQLPSALQSMKALRRLTLVMGSDYDLSAEDAGFDESTAAVRHYLAGLGEPGKRDTPFSVFVEFGVLSDIALWFRFSMVGWLVLASSQMAAWIRCVDGVVLVARAPWVTEPTPPRDARNLEAAIILWFTEVFVNVRKVIMRAEGPDKVVEKSVETFAMTVFPTSVWEILDLFEVNGLNITYAP